MAARKRVEKPKTGKAEAQKPAARKASPKRKTGGKRSAAPGEGAAASEPEAEADAKESAPASRSAKTAKAKKGATVSSMKVNLAHILALRPRVSPSFRQADFLTARHLLQDESYDSIEEAARAVAEKALAMTHEGPSQRGFKPGR